MRGFGYSRKAPSVQGQGSPGTLPPSWMYRVLGAFLEVEDSGQRVECPLATSGLLTVLNQCPTLSCLPASTYCSWQLCVSPVSGLGLQGDLGMGGDVCESLKGVWPSGNSLSWRNLWRKDFNAKPLPRSRHLYKTFGHPWEKAVDPFLVMSSFGARDYQDRLFDLNGPLMYSFQGHSREF